MVYCLIQIGYCLGLDPLRSIHHEQRALARCDGSGHLIREINVTRSIDKIELIFLALVKIVHLDSVALDCDALFFLQIHIIKDLIFHLSFSQGAGQFQKTVGQSTLAVIDVSDDTEIPYVLHTDK